MPKQSRDIARDFLPSASESGVFVKTDREAILQSVNNILQSVSGDWPFYPGLNAGIRELLFENFSDPVKKTTEALVENIILTIETRIEKILELEVTFQEDANALTVDCILQIAQTKELIPYTSVLKRVR